jgi:hypothetical protein
MTTGNQGEFEFNFDSGASTNGYDHWQLERRRAAEDLAHRLGLPLGRTVEIWLKDGVRLRGVLRLKEEYLFPEIINQHNLELCVDHLTFGYGEMESCVRRD